MIEIGTRYRVEQTVTEAMTAAAVGSGALAVFGTPFMLGMMENAALCCLQPFLTQEQGSVGIALNVTHDSPTPVGMRAWAEAEIVHVSENGKIVDFTVSAWDEKGPIGGGTHTRTVIHNERFFNKCRAKLENVPEEKV